MSILAAIRRTCVCPSCAASVNLIDATKREVKGNGPVPISAREVLLCPVCKVRFNRVRKDFLVFLLVMILLFVAFLCLYRSGFLWASLAALAGAIVGGEFLFRRIRYEVSQSSESGNTSAHP